MNITIQNVISLSKNKEARGTSSRMDEINVTMVGRYREEKSLMPLKFSHHFFNFDIVKN